MMDIGPKKFDRYLLPIFPSVALLAGLGLWLGIDIIAGRWDPPSPACGRGGSGG